MQSHGSQVMKHALPSEQYYGNLDWMDAQRCTAALLLHSDWILSLSVSSYTIVKVTLYFCIFFQQEGHGVPDSLTDYGIVYPACYVFSKALIIFKTYIESFL